MRLSHNASEILNNLGCLITKVRKGILNLEKKGILRNIFFINVQQKRSSQNDEWLRDATNALE